jgi:hypothetical protein
VRVDANGNHTFAPLELADTLATLAWKAFWVLGFGVDGDLRVCSCRDLQERVFWPAQEVSSSNLALVEQRVTDNRPTKVRDIK